VSNIYKEILKKYWGFDDFRPMQEDIIKSVGDGKDTLGLLPTGGGKSITFQVPALAKDGICIVVTPLIALMKDQVENLKKRGIKAYAIHSGLNIHEIQIAFDNCIFGNVKFLYLSPERLGTEMFLQKIKHLKVNLLAIDEAHCISQWGYDFRPSYLQIAKVREHLPNVPVLALTATATPAVVEDIQQQLEFAVKNVFSKSFERSNLAYVVRVADDKEQQLLRILTAVPGSAVVYVRNRKKTREYAEFLQRNGISADFFHAGLPQKIKDVRQSAWKNGGCRVMVSTNAFGMGIDKADVRVVVHLSAPDSLEAYFQEAGRAGRDEQKAFAVLLWSAVDKTQLLRNFDSSFPEPEVIKRVYDALGNFFQIAVGSGENMILDFNVGAFCKAFKFSVIVVFNSLKILQQAGYLVFSEMADIPSKVMVIMNNYELNNFLVSNSKLEPYLKLLLRSYTGLFTDYIAVNEDDLAKRLGESRENIYQSLLALSTYKVIHYIPQRTTPLVTYLQRREEVRHVVLPHSVYRDRKEQAQKRLESVINYATTTHTCRSTLLLKYFGQQKSNNCGHCDVCINRKKSELSDSEFAEIKEQLKSKLVLSSIDATELVYSLNYNKDKIWKVLNWLEEVDLVCEDENGYLTWCDS
jgi:ATP-dependent DNA helicase RecQ